jgi:threonine synthase
LQCTACSERFEAAPMFYGCPACKANGKTAPLEQEALLRQLLERGNHYPCTIFCPRAGYSNPFGIEGFKTIAFEIYEQIGRSAPDCVFVPTGSGDGIYGVWKGFRELHELGWIARRQR